MAISKRLRFDVFKRDLFTCQYCGRTPPSVTLEADHIVPRKHKGPDTVDNLVTSCADCNRGKAAVPLSEMPSSMVGKVAEMKERREQLVAFNDFLAEQEAFIQKQIDEIQAEYERLYPGWTLKESFCVGTLRTFLHHLTVTEIKTAWGIAHARCRDDDRAIKYFCGICWNWIKDPTTKDR